MLDLAREAITALKDRGLTVCTCESLTGGLIGATLVEVTARGSNKGSMVRRLAERLGISMDHVYCVGDETNDISMLTAAKEGFAPANCAQAVKDAGATIVADKNHDALADVIAKLEQYYT